ncbi:unnamed protein product [Chrysoparadoxa australica]
MPRSKVMIDKLRRQVFMELETQRTGLKVLGRNHKVSPHVRWWARLQLAKLPRDSSAVRIHKRCAVTGNPKGIQKGTNLSRHAFKAQWKDAGLPGISKGSW